MFKTNFVNTLHKFTLIYSPDMLVAKLDGIIFRHIFLGFHDVLHGVTIIFFSHKTHKTNKILISHTKSYFFFRGMMAIAHVLFFFILHQKRNTALRSRTSQRVQSTGFKNSTQPILVCFFLLLLWLVWKDLPAVPRRAAKPQTTPLRHHEGRGGG